MTMGEFSLIDLIHSCLKKTGRSNVYVATWSAGIKDVHQCKWMIETDLINDFKLLTDHSYSTRQRKYAASIEDLFGKENIRTSEIHAKFVVIKNQDWKLTIVSSMNLNANRTCETFSIYEDEKVCDFYMGFINHHFEVMSDGFEPRSSEVSKAVKSWFLKNENDVKNDTAKPTKHWSELL
jgi:hypothetical protein